MENQPSIPTEYIPYIAEVNKREAAEGQPIPLDQSGQGTEGKTLFDVLKRIIISLLKGKSKDTQTATP